MQKPFYWNILGLVDNVINNVVHDFLLVEIWIPSQVLTSREILKLPSGPVLSKLLLGEYSPSSPVEGRHFALPFLSYFLPSNFKIFDRTKKFGRLSFTYVKYNRRRFITVNTYFTFIQFWLVMTFWLGEGVIFEILSPKFRRQIFSHFWPKVENCRRFSKKKLR